MQKEPDEKNKNKKEKPLSKSKQGKLNRAAGRRFELKVREVLNKAGWIVDKWTNNVDLEKQELTQAKRKYNPFKKMLILGTGFPDFIGFKNKQDIENNYEVIGIEVKRNGFLSYEEKLKCKFYIENKIFSKIFIARAKKEGRRVEVELEDFIEKYGKKYDNI